MGDKLPYYTKSALMTSSEFAFYHLLKDAVQERYLIIPQMNVSAVLGVRGSGPDKFGNWQRINRKSVDFMLCDKETVKPLVAIEIDGGSHRCSGRQKRDVFVNQVFKDAGLRLVRVPVGTDFTASVNNLMEDLDDSECVVANKEKDWSLWNVKTTKEEDFYQAPKIVQETGHARIMRFKRVGLAILILVFLLPLAAAT